VSTFLLRVVTGVMSVRRRSVVPYKIEKTRGSVGLDSRHSRGQRRKGAHRRLNVHVAVGLGGGGRRQ
jgi:hypothetical protein